MIALEVIELDQTTTMFTVGIILPFLVGLLTKLDAPAKLKAGVNIVLVGIGTLITNAVNEMGHAVLSMTTIRDWAVGIVTSIGIYYGVFKPFDTGSKLMPNVGFGKKE